MGDPPPGPSALLLSMPWTTLDEPSLGLGILKAELTRRRIPCRVAHLNVRLLEHVERSVYERLGQLYAINDFMFSAGLEDGRTTDDQLDVLRAVVEEMETYELYAARDFLGPDTCVDFALRMREEIVPAYLERCMAVVDASGASLVGFTCLFDQTIPSLALAKLVKERHPDKLVVLGGYALERPVGEQVVRCFDFVDAVAFGEGEEMIGPLAEASLDRDRLASIPGLVFRDGGGAVHTSPEPGRVDLDRSPVPDYDDWFADLREVEGDERIALRPEVLPVESSRGCWWGEVSHCAFCGIDDDTIRYRAKSAGVVKDMLATLHERYGARSFRFADYILPRAYLKTLLPQLAGEGGRYDLHWEMKANVRAHEVELMRAAGIHAVQPGIESFSSPVLKRMRKGVSGIQNVLTLKLLREHGIDVLYNVLYGFRDDEAGEYAEMADRIPLLHHLPPTGSCMPVLTVRYAPMQVAEPDLRPKRQYEAIFSRDFRERIGFDLGDYCYTFERPYELAPELTPHYETLRARMARWLELYRAGEARLAYRAAPGGGVTFADSRAGGAPRELTFGGEHAVVHEAIARRVRSRAQVAEAVSGEIDAAAAAAALDDLAHERLILTEGERVVGLALPAECYGN